MQHAASDSASNSPQPTGTPFSSVFSSFILPHQSKINTIRRGPLAPVFDVFVDSRFVVVCRCCKIGANALFVDAGNVFLWALKMGNTLSKRIRLTLCRQIIVARWRAATGLGALGKALAHA